MLDRLPLEISPVVLNIHSTATEEAEATENAAVDQSIGTRLQGWKMWDKQVWTAKSLINKTYRYGQRTLI